MISTNNIKTNENEKKSPYITYGVQELTIKDMVTETASTGTKRVMFSVEGPEVKEEGFVGVDGAKGQVGRIRTSYLKTGSAQEEEFMKSLAIMADKFGVRSKLDAITANDMDSYIPQVASIFKGKSARFIVATEQRYNGEGKLRNDLKFARFGFVESLEVPVDQSKLTFKEQYHLKKAVKPDMEPASSNDLFQ